MSAAAKLRPNDFKRARALFDAGYSFIAVGSDLSILARRSEGLRAEFTTPAA